MDQDIIQLLLSSSATAQRCQRNWDLSKSIDDSILSCLKTVVKNSATKQNEEYYQVFFITNRKLIETIYQLSYDNIHYIKNPQTLAQLLVLFTGTIPTTNRNLAIQHTPEELEVNQNQGIGIASGQLVLAANLLGLKSGFCACFDKEEVSKTLNVSNPLLLVGIGYPDETKFRRANHVKDDSYSYFGTFEKPITITTIGETTSVETYDGILNPLSSKKSVTLVAPEPQTIKNSGDISMFSDDLGILLSEQLYQSGIKYTVEPLPYIKQWNDLNTEITLTWTAEDELALENFITEVKNCFDKHLSALGWHVI